MPPRSCQQSTLSCPRNSKPRCASINSRKIRTNEGRRVRESSRAGTERGPAGLASVEKIFGGLLFDTRANQKQRGLTRGMRQAAPTVATARGLLHPRFALVAGIQCFIGVTDYEQMRRGGRARHGRFSWLFNMVLRGEGRRRRQTNNSKADNDGFVHAGTPLWERARDRRSPLPTTGRFSKRPPLATAQV